MRWCHFSWGWKRTSYADRGQRPLQLMAVVCAKALRKQRSWCGWKTKIRSSGARLQQGRIKQCEVELKRPVGPNHTGPCHVTALPVLLTIDCLSFLWTLLRKTITIPLPWSHLTLTDVSESLYSSPNKIKNKQDKNPSCHRDFCWARTQAVRQTGEEVLNHD